MVNRGSIFSLLLVILMMIMFAGVSKAVELCAECEAEAFPEIIHPGGVPKKFSG